MAPSARPDSDTRLTYDDLFDFPDDGKRRELIDGELFVTPSPNLRHLTRLDLGGNEIDHQATKFADLEAKARSRRGWRNAIQGAVAEMRQARSPAPGQQARNREPSCRGRYRPKSRAGRADLATQALTQR